MHVYFCCSIRSSAAYVCDEYLYQTVLDNLRVGLHAAPETRSALAFTSYRFRIGLSMSFNTRKKPAAALPAPPLACVMSNQEERRGAMHRDHRRSAAWFFCSDLDTRRGDEQCIEIIQEMRRAALFWSDLETIQIAGAMHRYHLGIESCGAILE